MCLTGESMKVFSSWSGGKDTALALHRAMKESGIEVTHILNMAKEDGNVSRSHRLSTGLVNAQAARMNVTLLQPKASWNDYEEEFKKALRALKTEGVEAGIFGDIDLRAHRDWVERVCAESGVKAILPLWDEDREKLLREFIGAGFKASIVATESRHMGSEWLGRVIDESFIKDLKEKGGVDLCGEKGEYHTVVTDGPIFKEPIEIIDAEKVEDEKHWFLKIEKWK